MELCREWAVEVDQSREQYNLGAQEMFIVEFVGSLYEDIEGGDPVLSKVRSLHFTRIYAPDRDGMGAYVRLRLFVHEGDLPTVGQAVDDRLAASAANGAVFQVKKQDLDWQQVAEGYGGSALAPVFRDHLASVSRTAYELLRWKQEGHNLESVIWPWAHFFFNATRGHGRSVVEFAQGAVTGFVDNV